MKRKSLIPKDAKKLDHKIVRTGETTHKHQFLGADTELYEKDGVVYARLREPDTIVHEEHLPIALPAGEYATGGTREFSYDEMEARSVVD